MSKEDFKFLIDLQKRMNEQDENSQKHDFQASPYFWGVAENKIEWGIEEDYGNDEICLVHDCSDYNTIEQCKEFFIDQLDDELCDDSEELKEIENISSWRDIEDYIKSNNIDAHIVYGRKVEDVISKYTGCFLTKQACKDHIEKYGYNYSEPHTFAMTADRNPEFERVWNILKNTDWKQLAELKAENERLQRRLNLTTKYKDDVKEDRTKYFDKVKELQQQLKEKDEVIDGLTKGINALKGDHTGDTLRNVLDTVILPAYHDYLASNTKQVCEKIKKEFEIHQENWDKVCDWAERGLLPETTYNDVIDQIEKGGVNGQV